MIGSFKRIGVFAKPTGEDITQSLQQVCDLLKNSGRQVVLEAVTAQRLPNTKFSIFSADTIGAECDLIIVVGGDGSLLKAARAIADHNVPILGINRGNLGFLADIAIENLSSNLDAILVGEYIEEQRTMLNATVVQNGVPSKPELALNDVVLHHGDIARLIEFTIFIDDQFVVDQRADGVITSTPTGSTAYALSGGGPIVYPTLDVITLMPMFPHSLNTRPIVVNKNSKIKFIFHENNRRTAQFSADGQTHMPLSPGDEVHIQANKNSLRLIHPKNYDYFAVLREKLGWNIKLDK